jgi:hypothetical protein
MLKIEKREPDFHNSTDYLFYYMTKFNILITGVILNKFKMIIFMNHLLTLLIT